MSPSPRSPDSTPSIPPHGRPTLLLAVLVFGLLGLLAWFRGAASPSTPARPGTPSGATPDPLIADGFDIERGRTPGAALTSDPAVRQSLAEGVAGDTSLLARIVDRDTGAPLVGFRATLLPEGAFAEVFERRDGTTDERGEILWHGVRGSEVRIYPPYPSELFTLQRGSRNEVLHEVGVNFTIHGRVVDARGTPYPGATVWRSDGSILDDSWKVAESDAGGAFTVPVYGPGTYVFARAAGRAPSRVASLFPTEQRAEVHLDLGLGDATGRITGVVLSPSSVPVPGATVLAEFSAASLPPQEDASVARLRSGPASQPVHTDSTGRFEIPDVPPGNTKVSVSARGFPTATASASVASGATTEVRIDLRPGAELTGIARDSAGAPLSDVEVVVGDGRNRATTDGQGRYRIAGIRPGEISVAAAHEAFGRAYADITVLEGEQTRWDPVLEVGATLAGVVQFDDGRPFAGERVVFLGEDGAYLSTLTDDDGRFELPGCRIQEYEVRAAPPGFGLQVILARDVVPGDPELVLRFGPLPAWDAYLTGRILGPAGAEIDAVHVLGNKAGYQGFVEQTLAAGPFRLGPVPAGSWTLQFHAPDHPPIEVQTDLPAAQTVDLGDLRLPAPVPVTVRVRVPPQVDRPVRADLWGARLRGSGPHRQRVNLDSGRLDLTVLHTGRYTLQVTGSQVVGAVRELDVIAGQALDLEIILQPGNTREVQVTYPEGDAHQVVRFTTFDSDGRQLRTWRESMEVWNGHVYGVSFGFAPEAARLTAVDEDGRSANAELGGERVVHLALR